MRSLAGSVLYMHHRFGTYECLGPTSTRIILEKDDVVLCVRNSSDSSYFVALTSRGSVVWALGADFRRLA